MPYRNATYLDGYKELDNALEFYFKKFPTRRFSSRNCPICGNKMATDIHEVNSLKYIRKAVGGHLYNRRNNKIYILPICEKCNHRKGGFFLISDEDGLLLAP